MIITKNNLIKVALNLQQKQVLLKNEKVFLKYFSVVKFAVEHNKKIELNSINLSIIKNLKIVKTLAHIKKLTSGNFYTNAFAINVFLGNLKNVVLSKSGYIKIYENYTYKFLNLLVAGQNVFNGSRVNNFANKTLIFNKHFALKIFVSGNKLVFSCNKTIDNFAANSFYLTLSNSCEFRLSNAGLAAANLILLNSCKQTKFAREAKLSGKNGALCFGVEVFDANSMQNYINLTSVSNLLNFLEKPILISPINLNNFINSKANTTGQIVLRKPEFTNQVVNSSTFFISFNNSVFYAYSLFNSAVFKLPLMLGVHKIISIKSGIKIINLTENHTFYISTNCKIKSAKILNGELVCVFVGDVKFCISNNPATWHEAKPHNQSTLVKLERIFITNIVKTLFALNYSFYNITQVDNNFYLRLKQIIKNKQSLRYASQIIIKLAKTASSEAELKKLFKLSGLISSLPEKKANLTDFSARQNLTLAELTELTLEEQLELYKIKQQNPLDKNAKVC